MIYRCYPFSIREEMIHVSGNGMVGSFYHQCDGSGFDQHRCACIIGEIGLCDSVQCGFDEHDGDPVV